MAKCEMRYCNNNALFCINGRWYCKDCKPKDFLKNQDFIVEFKKIDDSL